MLCLSLLAGLSLPAAAQGDLHGRPLDPGSARSGLILRELPDGTALVFRNGAGRETVVATGLQSVSDPRLLVRGPVVAATWNAVGPGGSVEPHYGLSLNGGATFGRPRNTSYEILLRYAEFDPLRDGEPPVPADLRARPDHELWIVQYVTKAADPWREEIRALGAADRRYLGNHANVWRMSAATAAAVAGLPFVRWVGPFHPAYKLEDELLAQFRAGTLAPRRYRIEVGAWGPSEKHVARERLEALGGTVTGWWDESYHFEADLTPAQLVEVAHLSEVHGVDRWSAPEPDMNNVRVLFGANYIESVAGYTGTGVRAEVMDGGLDTVHPDWGLAPIKHGTVSEGDAHGTSTFGINFSRGYSHANARGLCPSAQGIISDYDTYGNRYTFTSQLVAAPYYGVYQSNSWGHTQGTVYNTYSQEMDDICMDFDLVITQSQSNTGNQSSRPEAWAKNIVAVGGINHRDNQNEGDDYWGGASTGPAADGRIKPNLAGFYDSIWTSDADPGGYSGGNYYTGFSGTSAASPMTAGSFGLFFEMWHNGIFGNTPGPTVFDSRPHQTLARAFLINNAHQWTFSGTTHNLTRTHQGWGRPDLKRIYDYRGETFWVNETDLLRDLESKSYTITVGAGEPEFRATLVYIDPPGTTSSSQHRINDLSLKVTSPSGTVYWGNNGLLAGNWSTSGGSSNTKDTEENVFVQNPAAGTWTVQVFADDVNQDTHPENGTSPPDADYALVVTPGPNPSGCANTNTISLSGPSSVSPGSTATFSYGGAEPNSPFWIYGSRTNSGSIINGQCFDIGPGVSTGGTGTTAPTGSGTWTSNPVPPRWSGWTIYVEMRVDGPSGTRDSTMVTVTVL